MMLLPHSTNSVCPPECVGHSAVRFILISPRLIVLQSRIISKLGLKLIILGIPQTKIGK